MARQNGVKASLGRLSLTFRIRSAAVALTLLPLVCTAQEKSDYPAKPVRVIVASAAGGPSDIQSRLLAQKLGESLKRQFVVENRPGAGGTIGYGVAAKAAPDGYTLLSVVPTLTFSPALQRDLPFDPIKDFTPISLVGRAPYIVAVHPTLPVRTMKDLIALAKAKPNALAMGQTNGSPNHLAAVYFLSAADVKIRVIPYKAFGQALIDAMAGEVQVVFGSPLNTLPHVRSGKLRALAVSSARRAAILPQLPTVAESGVPGYEVSGWYGWVAPTGTATAIIDLLSRELARTVKLPDVANTLAEDGAEPVGSTPAEFRQLIAEEVPRWLKIVKASGMRLE
jgi:tripartite-type tricarboxylate transporter receptor subunit TctC